MSEEFKFQVCRVYTTSYNGMLVDRGVDNQKSWETVSEFITRVASGIAVNDRVVPAMVRSAKLSQCDQGISTQQLVFRG